MQVIICIINAKIMNAYCNCFVNTFFQMNRDRKANDRSLK